MKGPLTPRRIVGYAPAHTRAKSENVIGHPSSAYVGVRSRQRPRCALNPPRKHTMANPTKEQIIHRAHELWEQNGKPEGRDDEFYHQA